MSPKDAKVETMKCIIATEPGMREDYDKVLQLSEDFPRPVRGKGQILVKVKACSLAPGDVRVLSQMTKMFQHPPGGFPYVPGGDIAGIAEEADPERDDIKKGDRVLCRFRAPLPLGGLAESCAMDSALSHVLPDDMSFEEGCAASSSPIVAIYICEALKTGARVLVIGATGGVGSHVIQLAKRYGASYLAVTTSDVSRLDEYEGIDRVIDYNEEDWWDIEEFKQNKFDIVMDFAAPGGTYEKSANVCKPKKEGGEFLTLIGDHHEVEGRNLWQAIGLAAHMLKPWFRSKFHSGIPKYVMFDGALPNIMPQEKWDTLFKLYHEGALRIVLDERGPFPFTAQGVRDAFRAKEARHAHGKIVVEIEK